MQYEEGLFREDSCAAEREIDALSDIMHGAMLTRIQADAMSYMDSFRDNARRAFQAENEQLENQLHYINREKKILMDDKKRLEEEME